LIILENIVDKDGEFKIIVIREIDAHGDKLPVKKTKKGE